ncbi:alcohol dehydrogenase [Microbacterium sp. X-17]|uniref:alcohol dehydrogenase n=1 Tax=Microbacterium sp. X-17 TaxID=3144404 RepID=UPI0031F4912D
MRSYVVENFTERLVTREQPPLEPTGTEVIVRVAGSGVCHTDLHLQDGFYDLGGGKRLRLADRGILPPLTLGHEIAGTLERVGPDAPIAPSDWDKTYIVYPWLGCGTCAPCLDGDEQLCATPNSIGVARPGGYADECLVPHPRYLVDATGIDPTLGATYACSGLTAYSALRKVTADRERDVLLIIGLGGVGYSGLLIARALGYERIVVADIDPQKRTMAQELDGITALDPGDPTALTVLAELGGVASAVDFVGTTRTVEFGLAALRKGGACIVVGLFGGDVTIPLPPLVQRSTTLRGSYVGTLQELVELVELVKRGDLPPLPVEALPLDAANDALTRLRAGRVSGRLVLVAGRDTAGEAS